MKKIYLLLLLNLVFLTIKAQNPYYRLKNFDSVGIVPKLILNTVASGSSTDSLLTKKANGGIYKLSNTLGQWTGVSTNLVAATGRTSLGGSTVGQNIFTLTDPSAITFPRFNADNTVTALTASNFLTAIGGSPLTGGTGYIQNQTASAQAASMRISGTIEVQNVVAFGATPINGTRLYLTTGTVGRSALFLQGVLSQTANLASNYDPTTTTVWSGIRADGRYFSTIPSVVGDDLLRYADASVINATTTALSVATLNSTYPNQLPGFRVICHLITGAPVIYTKATENGSSDVWLTTATTTTP